MMSPEGRGRRFKKCVVQRKTGGSGVLCHVKSIQDPVSVRRHE